MRSRWFHTPVLHAPAHGEEKTVSWLELFYDLIFVAAIIQLGDYLSDEVSLAGFGMFALHFVPLWIAWTGFTFYANRFDVDDFLHRALVLAQMFSVGVMAISSHEAMHGHPAAFALAFAVAQAMIAILYLRAWKQVPEARRYARFWGSVFAIGAVAFAVSALLPTPYCYLAWVVGLGAILTAPSGRISRELSEAFPTDQEHLSERYGLLTIIVLGESFVKVLSYLTASEHLDMESLLTGFFNLTLTVSIWWIYFDDVAGAEIRGKRGGWVIWLYSHIPLTMAITAVGVAVKKAIKFDMLEVAPDNYRWLLAGTLALTFLSVAMIDSVTERANNELSDRNRVMVRSGSAIVMLLLGQVGGTMSAGVFLALVAALCVAQVLFDMIMAPMEESAVTHHAVSTADLARARQAGEGEPRSNRPSLAEAVRKGAPAHLRRDLYFLFIEGSWTRVMLTFGFVYGMLNVVFAALYQLEPGSIEGDTQQTFGDAFAFSVQTLASLGYGHMTPATSWGNALVTVEAAVGMLFIALATGLMFAKASRPQSSVLFAKRMVMNTHHGLPTLMLRVANARGNEVVDAVMTVSALIEEISAEGHHMRRLHELKLTRDRTPVFTMSWLAMHEITEESPLATADPDDIIAIIVTLMGHDGTYGQTTYARQLYYPEDILRDHRYVDVLSQLPDGRLMIDLTQFHDTVPDAAEPEAAPAEG